MGRLGDIALKLIFFGYIAIAFFVGVSKDDTGGTVSTILSGALWPWTLLVAWIRQGYVPG